MAALGYRKKGRGGVWVVIESLGNKRYREEQIGIVDDFLEANGSTVLDFEQAKKAAVARIASWHTTDRAFVNGAPPTVRTAVEAYVGMRDARENAEGLARRDARNRLRLHVLADEIGDQLLHELNEHHLCNWLDRRSASIAPSTIRRVANDFKAALNMAARKHRSVLPPEFSIVVKHGLAITEASSPQARDGAALPDDDVRRIIDAARGVDADLGWDGDLWMLVLALASTGARFSQIIRMRVADLQIGHSRLMVPTSRKGRGVKKASHIAVRVGQDVIQALRPAVAGRRSNAPLLERWRHQQTKATEFALPRWERCSRGPWLHAAELARPWQAILKRAGLPADTVPYSLRHSSIVRMLKAGLPIRLVASLHDTSSVVIERHYASAITSAMDDLAVRAVVPLVGKMNDSVRPGASADSQLNLEGVL